MKKIFVFLITLLFVGACNAKPNAQVTQEKPMPNNQKILVAYFSATGTTKKVAQNLAKATNADIYEIKPTTPYTSADLNWRDDNSRSSVEMKNKSSRPEIVTDNFSVKEYDTVYLGFPIWWGTAPRVVQTFLESQDFANKTIILFATSGSSTIGNTGKDLQPSVASSAKVIKGKTLNGNPSVEELKAWANTFK